MMRDEMMKDEERGGRREKREIIKKSKFNYNNNYKK